MLLNIFLPTAEKIFNCYLAQDTEKAQALYDLKGKVVKIEIHSFGDIFIMPTDTSVQFAATYSGEINTTVSGSPIALLKMWRSNSAALPKDIHIAGDVHLAQTLKQALGEVDIDWEEQLSKLLGDALAHSIMRRLRKVKHWQEDARESLVRSTKDYLQEEAGYFPPRIELEDFFREVDELRHQAERFGARIQRLELSVQHENN